MFIWTRAGPATEEEEERQRPKIATFGQQSPTPGGNNNVVETTTAAAVQRTTDIQLSNQFPINRRLLYCDHSHRVGLFEEIIVHAATSVSLSGPRDEDGMVWMDGGLPFRARGSFDD